MNLRIPSDLDRDLTARAAAENRSKHDVLLQALVQFLDTDDNSLYGKVSRILTILESE